MNLMAMVNLQWLKMTLQISCGMNFRDLTLCTTALCTKLRSPICASVLIFTRKSFRPGRTMRKRGFSIIFLPHFHTVSPFPLPIMVPQRHAGYLQLPSCRNCPGKEALFLLPFLLSLMLALFSSSHGFLLVRAG